MPPYTRPAAFRRRLPVARRLPAPAAPCGRAREIAAAPWRRAAPAGGKATRRRELRSTAAPGRSIPVRTHRRSPSARPAAAVARRSWARIAHTRTGARADWRPALYRSISGTAAWRCAWEEKTPGDPPLPPPSRASDCTKGPLPSPGADRLAAMPPATPARTVGVPARRSKSRQCARSSIMSRSPTAHEPTARTTATMGG